MSGAVTALTDAPEESSYTCKKSTAVVYYVRPNEPFAWADITIEEWKGGGSFKCVSDFGNYSFIWSAIGSRTLRAFLSDLDFDYFMGKTTNGNYLEFSAEDTCREIKRDVLRLRRRNGISKDIARACHDEMELLSFCFSETEFLAEFTSTYTLREIYRSDYEGVDFRKVHRADCEGFWKVIWPCILDVWKKEPDAWVKS